MEEDQIIQIVTYFINDNMQLLGLSKSGIVYKLSKDFDKVNKNKQINVWQKIISSPKK